MGQFASRPIAPRDLYFAAELSAEEHDGRWVFEAPTLSRRGCFRRGQKRSFGWNRLANGAAL
jgi:hypothetical protein